MKKPAYIFVAATVLVISFGHAAFSGGKPILVSLTPIGGSKISGTATITQAEMTIPENSPQVVVAISLEGVFVPEDEWPAAIHSGRCARPGSSAGYPLRPVVMGRSTTHLSHVSISKLQSPPNFYIDIRSPKDNAKVVACGNILLPR